MTGIRFSPNPNQAQRIDWRPWGRAAFDRAQAADKPVLLSIAAPWCYWCHVMDETTYSDPEVQALIGRSFVAVRADNDHRPDLNARYNVGGWPTTAFLTPHGGLIGGATYLPPDQFLAMLAELAAAYRADKPRLYTQSRELWQRRREQARRVAAGAEIESALTDRVSRIVAGAYDAANGGFGSEPKFPNPAIARFILHQYRVTGEPFYAAMLHKTLDGMADSAMFDAVDGGFFRYSAAADWSQPQREKLLEDNVQLARLYLDAAIILANPRYREVAGKTINFLLNHLHDAQRQGFRGSQGAHSDYFALDADRRAALAAAPPADPSCYTGPGALTAAALIDAAWKLGRPELASIGLDVLERIDQLAQSGDFSHVYPDDDNGGNPDDTGAAPAFLSDWAGLLAGLMQAHAATAEPRYLDRAVAVAAEMVTRFFDETGGGFFDIEADANAVGHLQVREKPMPENMLAVQSLLRLHHATRNDDYRQICEAALSAFAAVFREQGEFAADFGLAVSLFANPPVEVTVEGRPEDPAGRDLLHAAVRLNSPHLEIKTVAATQAASPALAHVCLDTLCLPPVYSPAALADAVAGLSNGGPGADGSPFQDILRIFPGD